MSFAQRWFHRTMAVLLQSNRLIPPRSDAEIAAEVERNYRWNFAFNLLDGASFFFGLSFISSATIAPLFISKLTTSPLPIALVAIIAQAGWSLPQLFTANLIERLPLKKPAVVNVGFFSERLPMWLLVVSAMVAATLPNLALALFLIGFAWHHLGAGAVGTAWQELIARCFPVERRGRYFGTTTFIGTGVGALGAGLSTWILRSFPFSTNFVYTFLIAAIAITVSWIFLALVREPAQPVETPRQSSREFFSKLSGIVRSDHNYRRFLIARSLIALGSLGTGFITVSALQNWQVADGTVGIYTAVMLIGQTVGNLTSGLFADRHGHKLSIEFGTLSSVSAFAIALLAPSAGWYFAVFFLLGVSTGAFIVSGTLIIMEFPEPRRRPTYIGLTNTIVGLVSIVAPLLGAWLAGFGYGWVFGTSIIINLVALVAMRLLVKEPRHAAAA